MPGHVAKLEGPDPDPLPWLAVSDELSVKLKAKPYDAKKSCWVPNKATGGYDEGLIVEKDGEKVTVEIMETKEVTISNVILFTGSIQNFTDSIPNLHIIFILNFSAKSL